MRRVSVADAKAHLSELLAAVESGQELQPSRRGRAIARLAPEPQALAHTPFDFAALAAFVDAVVRAARGHGAACRNSE